MEIDSPEAKASRAESRRRAWYDIDTSLTMLLDLTFGFDGDDDKASIELTLVTASGVITGKVVSQDAWNADIIAAVEPASEQLANRIRKANEEELKLESVKQKIREEEGTVPRSHVHFDEAKLLVGASWTPIPRLRVRLRDVTAWTIGELRAS